MPYRDCMLQPRRPHQALHSYQALHGFNTTTASTFITCLASQLELDHSAPTRCTICLNACHMLSYAAPAAPLPPPTPGAATRRTSAGESHATPHVLCGQGAWDEAPPASLTASPVTPCGCDKACDSARWRGSDCAALARLLELLQMLRCCLQHRMMQSQDSAFGNGSTSLKVSARLHIVCLAVAFADKSVPLGCCFC